MSSKSIDNLRIIYILYLVGAFTGVTMIVGVILAYIERGKLTDITLESHVEKQIRMFWIWLIVLVVLYVVIFAATIPALFAIAAGGLPVIAMGSLGLVALLSFLVPLGLFLYVLISSIQSLRTLDSGEPIDSF